MEIKLIKVLSSIVIKKFEKLKAISKLISLKKITLIFDRGFVLPIWMMTYVFLPTGKEYKIKKNSITHRF